MKHVLKIKLQIHCFYNIDVLDSELLESDTLPSAD